MPKDREKLYAKLQRTKAGWKASDFDRLFRAFGFEVSDSGRDTQYWHPDHPGLVCYVSRSSGDLPIGYATTAAKVIGRLKEIEAAKKETDSRASKEKDGSYQE